MQKRKDINRETLYEEIWRTPMIEVGKEVWCIPTNDQVGVPRAMRAASTASVLDSSTKRSGDSNRSSVATTRLAAEDRLAATTGARTEETQAPSEFI
jgi:hypothetical protein